MFSGLGWSASRLQLLSSCPEHNTHTHTKTTKPGEAPFLQAVCIKKNDGNFWKTLRLVDSAFGAPLFNQKLLATLYDFLAICCASDASSGTQKKIK